MEDTSPRSRRDLECPERHGEISARSLQSRRDGGYLAAIWPRFRMSRTSWRDLGEISTISARSRQSRRVLGNLGEMEDISPRSRRDLESNKHHGEISARSLQSRRDLINLDEISPISARSRQSRQDLGKNFARADSMIKLFLKKKRKSIILIICIWKSKWKHFTANIV